MAVEAGGDILEHILTQLAQLDLGLKSVVQMFEGLAQYCMNMFANMVATLAGDGISALVAMIPYVGPALAPIARSITVSYIQGSFKTYNGYVI